MSTEDLNPLLTITELSSEVQLPESTIRYYLSEFSEYFSEKYEGDHRVFSDEDRKLFEYLRYLIKRQDCSIKQAGEILSREQQFTPNDFSVPEDPENEKPGRVVQAELESLRRGMKGIRNRLTNIEQHLEELLTIQKDGGNNN